MDHSRGWTIALFNFVHVGFESGIGGWLTTYADRVQGEPVVNLISPTFLYFLFFVAGRGIAFVFRFMSENQVLFLDIGLIIPAGMLLILSANDLTCLGIGAAVSGFRPRRCFHEPLTLLPDLRFYRHPPCNTAFRLRNAWRCVGYLVDRLCI